MTNANFHLVTNADYHFFGFADAKPSEAIQPHQLPGLAVAVVFPGKPGKNIIEIPVNQYKDYPSKAKGNAARKLAEWLRGERLNGLRLTGFFQVAKQVEVAMCGLSLIEELPNTRVEPHFNTYRLYFGNDHVDFAQAVALEYYEFTINLGVLRATQTIPPQFRKLFVAMDRFPGRSPENGTPGTAVETTPGARFLDFVREHSSTGQHIRNENKTLGLTAKLGTMDWWRPNGDEHWREGKSHPHFVLTDWLVAAALAESYPAEFAASFGKSRSGEDTVAGLVELHASFKEFDLWSMTESAGYVKGSTQIWTVPDDARAFIFDRTKK